MGGGWEVVGVCNRTTSHVACVWVGRQVRVADWRALSAAQAAAADAGDVSAAVAWPAVERHWVAVVKALLEELPKVGGEGSRGLEERAKSPRE